MDLDQLDWDLDDVVCCLPDYLVYSDALPVVHLESGVLLVEFGSYIEIHLHKVVLG